MNMLRLIKLQLRVNFGLSALSWYRRNKDKKFWGALGIILLAVFSLSPIIFVYMKLLDASYGTLLMIGQQHAILTMATVVSSVFVFFFGLAYVMSAFYFSRDLSFLLPLPLKPREILGAKFSVVLINNYITVLPFFVPALLLYGIREGSGILYWLAGLIIFLLLPVVPLALSTLVILPLMRFANMSRMKDTVRLAGMFLLMIFILVFNYFITKVPHGNEAQFIQQLLADRQGITSFIGRVYPAAVLATRALTSPAADALLNFLLYAALSVAGIALTFLIADRLFYRGLIGGQEVNRGKKISAQALEKKISRATSPAIAIASREIKVLFRTPIYLFNSVMILFLLPVVLLIPVLSGGGISQVLGSLQNLQDRSLLNLAAAGFIGSMAIFTPAASSSFSREGRLFWISQVIPVSPAEQVRGKILYSLLITLLAVPLLIIFSVLVAGWSIPELVLIILLGTLSSLPAITISLLIDLLRPYLDWDNPQKAIKQNFNVVLAMVVAGAAYFLMYLAVKQLYVAGRPDFWLYLAGFGLSLVLGLVPYAILMRIAEARYRSINS